MLYVWVVSNTAALPPVDPTHPTHQIVSWSHVEHASDMIIIYSNQENHQLKLWLI